MKDRYTKRADERVTFLGLCAAFIIAVAGCLLSAFSDPAVSAIRFYGGAVAMFGGVAWLSLKGIMLLQSEITMDVNSKP